MNKQLRLLVRLPFRLPLVSSGTVCSTLSLGIGLAILVACKETTHTSGQSDQVPAARKSNQASYFAAGTAEIQQTSDFFFGVWNQSFTARFDDLPKSAEIPKEKQPMSGSYYPQVDHGTNKVMVGGQSALQKYDAAFFGGTNTASAWEEANHTSNISWAGHCNGFAAAGQRHPTEPKKSVVRGNVTFAPQDIKALLAEIYMNADFQFLGGSRGCVTPQSNILGPGSRPDPKIMDQCQGMNPGTLHVAMANWIGRMQHGFVIDVYSGDEVWNYPAISYSVLSSTYVSAQQAAQAVDGTGSYKFNPGAVKFVNVHAKISFIEAFNREVLTTRTLGVSDLTYILELDAAGDVIGGEWTGGSIRSHPNFIWLAFEPLPSNGSAQLGNPHLEPAKVLSLWADSVDDPNNPPADVTRQTAPSSWGQFAGFSAVLDGFTSGAAFAGKPLQLRVTRSPSTAGPGVELSLGLNGSPLAAVTSTGSENFSFPIAAGPGLNRFQFTWKKNGAVIYDEYLRFRVSR